MAKLRVTRTRVMSLAFTAILGDEVGMAKVGTKPTREKVIVSIADLKPDPANVRRHNPRNIGMVVDSLHQVGAARSIVIDENDTILAGNGLIEAAAEAGITKLQIVEADGETVIAVRRRGLTPEQKVKLAIFDNRTAELADWDPDALQAIQQQGADLSAYFREDDLAELLSIVPEFEPVGIDEQGRLDQKAPVTCPQCGHEFVPKS